MSYRVVGDWGTSNLRLFRIEDGRVVDRCEGPGIAAAATTPEATLRMALAPWRAGGDPVSVHLSGMVGSRTGLVEAPYADCPADAVAWSARAVRIALDAIPVTVAAGLACVQPSGAPDVMRGEETQIFGAALDTEGRALIALPGTHGKWAVVEDGRVRAFRTFLTGETFALLRDHSTLNRVPPRDDAGDDEAQGFDTGLTRAHEPLTAAMFEARSAQLRDGRSPAWGLGFLSGLLIGHEVAAMAAAAREAGSVVLIGAGALVDRYAKALARLDIPSRALDGDACAIAGLALLETAHDHRRFAR